MRKLKENINNLCTNSHRLPVALNLLSRWMALIFNEINNQQATVTAEHSMTAANEHIGTYRIFDCLENFFQILR